MPSAQYLVYSLSRQELRECFVWQNRHQLLILIPLRWTGLVLLPLNGPADEHAFREAVAELPVVVWAAIACESRAQPGVLSARQGLRPGWKLAT